MKTEKITALIVLLLFTAQVNSSSWNSFSLGRPSTSQGSSKPQSTIAASAPAAPAANRQNNYQTYAQNPNPQPAEKIPPTKPIGPSPQPAPQPAPQPVQPTPQPIPVAKPKCQPFQIEKYGQCYCDDDNCNNWKDSHLCTEETADGECVCNDIMCSGKDKSCSEFTIQGECVACRQETQQLDCLDHQVCYQNQCVCSDVQCRKQDLVCEREYSKSSECVDCRKDQQCASHERCSDQGLCICSKAKCEAQDLHCLDQDPFGDCVICNQDEDCQSFQICIEKECICQTDKCPEGTFCDEQTAQGICQQCFEDEDCDQSFQNCTNNVCVCNTDKCDMIITGSVCIAEEDDQGRCSECTGDQQCNAINDEVCEAGRCLCTDENCVALYPGTLQFCLDEITGPCVECRKDEDCSAIEKCNDQGTCECSDDLCATMGGGQVCNVAGTACTECRDDNERFCQGLQECMAGTCVDNCAIRASQGIQVAFHFFSTFARTAPVRADYELIVVEELDNGMTNILTNFQNLDEYDGVSFLTFMSANFETSGQGFASSGDYITNLQAYRYYNVFNANLEQGTYAIYLHPEDCFNPNLSATPRTPTNVCTGQTQSGQFQITAGGEAFFLQYTFSRVPTTNVIDIAQVTVSLDAEASAQCMQPIYNFEITSLSVTADFQD